MKTMKWIFGRAPCWRASAVLLLSLSGCAGTHVASETSRVDPGVARPRIIALSIQNATLEPKRASRAAAHDRAVAETQDVLAKDLRAMLLARHLAVAAPGQTADMVLGCTLTRVRPGSTIARLLIGYGAGKAELAVATTLTVEGHSASPLLSFVTTSTTGGMPGAGLGVASAATAAGTAVHLAGPLLGVPGTLRQGLRQEAQQTTDRIDERLAAYFQLRHWPYPRPPSSWLSRL